MPSWEEIVNRVVIGSNYYNVFDSAVQWGAVFRSIDDVRAALEELSTLSESWRGSAADGFRSHLQGVIQQLQDLADDHRKIKDGLNTLGEALRTAVGEIEVPTWMYDDIAEKQRVYHETGEVYLYEPGSFAHGYLQYVTGGFLHSLPGVGSLWDSIEGWVRDREARAQQAYETLAGRYSAEYGSIPEGTPTVVGTIGDLGDVNPSGGLPPMPPGSVGAPSGVGSPDLNSLRPGVGNLSSLPGADSGYPDSHGGEGGLSGLPGLDTRPSGTSLQGVTPSVGAGVGGVGGLGGAGGLGSLPGAGLGAGAGLGGAGAGGSGSGVRLPPLGPAVMPPGMAGVAGAAGRAAGGRGAGASSARAGRGVGAAGAARGGVAALGPGGLGARGAMDEDERTTWLQEDEDVWGANTDAPPGVLGT